MAQLSSASAEAGGYHTYIFLDVDGVLNVGLRERTGSAPILFSTRNVERALKQVRRPGEQETADKLISVTARKLGHGESGTYAALATSSGPGPVQDRPTHREPVQSGPVPIVPTLVERLVQIIHAAGPRRKVILSSTWRLPKHQERMVCLEQEIACYLGKGFEFDAKTPLRQDNTAPERLRCIGDFIHGLAAPQNGERLRLLVLDDFFVTRLRGLSLDGRAIDSAEDAEQYLQGRLQAADKASVRVVQPFDEWVMMPKGLRVQIGAGLTMKHLNQAMSFLTAGADCGSNCVGKTSSLRSRQDSDASTNAGEGPEELATLSEDSDREDEAPEAHASPSQALDNNTVGGGAEEMCTKCQC